MIPRILITLLGIAFILMGTSEILLGFAGESTGGVITEIRREGGERAEVKPNRYTYNIAYVFTLPDGREIDGFTKKIGSPVYLKADGSSTVKIRYFSVFPYVNAIERDTGFGVRQLLLILTGGVLIFLINFINKKREGKELYKSGNHKYNF